MKQWLAITLSLLLVLSCVGCSGSPSQGNDTSAESTESGETVSDLADSAAETAKDTAQDTSEETEETATTPPESQPEPGTQPDKATQPENPSEEEPVNGSDTLDAVLERLLTSGGISLTVDGTLSVVTSLFGFQVVTDMPVWLSLVTATNGLSAQAEIPLAGSYSLTLVDGVLYLSEGEKKYYCALPEAETGAESEDAAPAESEEEAQASSLEQVVALIKQLTANAQWDMDPLTGSVTATVPLSEEAARLAEQLRAAMEEENGDGEEAETGESSSGSYGIDRETLLAWLDTVAASSDARLVFTAALDGEDVSVSVSLFCPVDVSSLLSLLSQGSEGSLSGLPSGMSSSGTLALTMALRCGQMSVALPEDAEDYSPTDWPSLQAALASILRSLLSNSETPSETVA
jgi:hypothetical protein